MKTPAKAGDLLVRVRFDRQVETSSPYGGTTTSWQAQFTRSASVKVEGGQEAVQAQRLTGKIQYIIYVRKDSDTKLILPSWRGAIMLNGDVQQYIALKTVDVIVDPAWVYIKAESGAADGG